MILLGLVFLSAVFLIFTVHYSIEYQRGQWRLRSRITKYDKEETQLVETKRDTFFVRLLQWLGNKVKPKDIKEISKLQKEFLRAGFKKDISLIFFGSKITLALMLPIMFFILRVVIFKTMPTLQVTLIVLMLASVGFYLPNLWIKNRIGRRKESIFRGFPDALDLMVVCVEAGTSLDAAITRVGEELSLGNMILSSEFKLLSLELRAGMSRRQALQNLSLRCDLDDITSLVTLLIQTDKFGTSVAQALRVYSDSMRTSRQQRAEELAAKLPVKMLFPMAVFLFPALLVVLIGPAGIRIIQALTSVARG